MARLSEVIGRYVDPPGAAPPADDESGEDDEEGERGALVRDGFMEEEEEEEEVEEEELEVFYQGGAKVQEETLVAASVPPDATDASPLPGNDLEAPPPDQPPRGFAVFINAPELLGMQQALFQRAWGCQVLDRFTVVLQIFRARAATREAHLRLELAELDFHAARLSDDTVWQVGKGRDQQRGGGGGSTRGGPGEKALLEKKSELAQRRAALRRKLKGSSGRSEGLRGTARARDADAGRRVPRVALVGYTNAGKSALQERLAPRPKLERRASDALFASLDTHSRRGHLASGNEALFVDTVGFIRRLSPGLRGCFEDTLQAAAEADLLLHVLDASSPFLAQQRAAVRATLGALELPPALLSGCIEVYTKADLLDEEARRQWRDALEEEPSDGGALLVSAVDGSGLSELTSAISTQLGARLGRARKTLRLPLDGGAALAQQLAFLHGHPRVAVVEQRDSDDGSALEVVADMDEGTHRMFVGQRWT
jgi:GTP-binding protein HflX